MLEARLEALEAQMGVTLDDIPLFSMLKSKMDYTGHRQRLIAENVANANTPGYAPRDLKPYSFSDALRGTGGPAPVTVGVTNAAHIAVASGPPAGPWKPENAPDSEVTLDGNQVVLEEQMLKMTEARLDYDTAVSLYQKSLSMLRMAARRPGA